MEQQEDNPLTGNQVGVMELADGVGLVPGHVVPEVPVEHRKTLFW